MVYNPSQQLFVVYNPIQQLPVVYNSSQQLSVVSNPSQQQLVLYSPSRQEDVEGALGEEEKEETLRKVRKYSMAGIFPPCSCTASRQDSGHVSADPGAVYIVLSREI